MYTPDWNTVYNTQDLNTQRQNVEAQNALARARANQGGGGVSMPSGYNPIVGGGTTGGGGLPIVSPGGLPSVSPSGVSPGQTLGQNVTSTVGANQSTSTTRAQNTADSLSQNFASSYIPEYSQTPILEEIAKYSRSMAPQVYQWGMDQFNKNQGNIDALMRSAMSYASPQRIAASMGRAEAGVQQGAEAGRQSAIRDLQSFGIDPSSGRYAALDNASRVQSAASAAGAGNQQRMADQAQGSAMQNQAISSGLSNVQTGYGAAGAANALLGTASNLKYSPLGNVSAGTVASTSQGTNASDVQSSGYNVSSGSGYNESQAYDPAVAAGASKLGGINVQYTSGANIGRASAEGGYIGYDESPSAGAKVDDVQARLTAGEFVIPKDVSEWMGQKFFYELMAKARKMRAMSNGEHGGQQQVGYGAA